jgi:type IV pilus assembly protein PilW
MNARRTARWDGLSRQAGLSLVELMVALAIGAGLMAALVALVVSNSRASNELESSSRQIENGRYAIDLLSEEISLAGFYGEVPQGAVTFTTPATCATLLANQGWSAAGLQVPVPLQGLAGATAPTCIANHRTGTALLTLHRVSTQAATAGSVTAGNPHLQTSNCEADPAGVDFVFSDAPAALTLRQRNCTTGSPVRRFVKRTYFIASCSECTGDRIPTLKRIELVGGRVVETPIAEGIEELQFEFGFDTDSDGSVDVFRTGVDGIAGSPENAWGNVVAVRVHLIARGTEAFPGFSDERTFDLGLHGARGPFADGFKRRSYTTLVRVMNPAGARE